MRFLIARWNRFDAKERRNSIEQRRVLGKSGIISATPSRRGGFPEARRSPSQLASADGSSEAWLRGWPSGLKPENICGNANFIFHTLQAGYMVPSYLKICIMAP